MLVDYLRLREFRRELRREAGAAFNSISSLLGDLTNGKKGKLDTISRVKTVNAIQDFAEAL
jgi:hypothetical protein